MAALENQVISLENALGQQKNPENKSIHKLRQEILKEATEATTELIALSVVWKQIQEGHQPDIALLLGRYYHTYVFYCNA